MATAFIVLSYVHIVPLRLAIMVISRDIFILVGSFLYLLLLDSSDIRPTGLSKANTAVQILTVIYFLAVAAFPAEAKAMGTGMGSLLRPGRHADLRGHDGRLRAPVPVPRHPEALRCVRAPGRSSSRIGVGVEAVTPGSPADRAGIVAGDRILSVSGQPVEDLLDLHFLTSRSRFTLAWRDASGARRKKEFRLEGETPGIFPGADPRTALPQPVHLLLRPPAAEGASPHPVREGRGRPPLLPSRAIRHLFGSFRRGGGEDRPVPPLAALRVDPHDRPGTAPADAREPAGGRRDARDAAADPRRDRPSRPDRRLPRRQRRRGARAKPSGTLRPASRAPHGGGGPGGAHVPSGRTAAAAPGHDADRRGKRSICSVRWAGNSGKARTGSRSRSPPTNIT